jgi:ABC-type multidrug transport system ATPase subunit
MDEPSMGLAPLLVKEVFAEILKMKDLGLTVLLVEQNAIATLQIADRAYVMETGEITLEGTAADLAHNPEVKRAYLGKGGQQPWRPPAPPTSFPDGSDGRGRGGGNPKAESRKPKEIRSPKSEEAKPQPSNAARPGAEADRQRLSRSARSDSRQGVGGLGLRISDFFRISGFGLRIWQPDHSGNVELRPRSSPVKFLA